MVVQRVRVGLLRRVLVGQQELVGVAVVVVQEVQVEQRRVQVGQRVLVGVVVVVVPGVQVGQQEVVGSSSSAAAAGQVVVVHAFLRQWSFQVVAAVAVVPPLGARLVQAERVVQATPAVLREVGEVELVPRVVQVVLAVRDRLLLLGCVLCVPHWCRPGRKVRSFPHCRHLAGRWVSPRTAWTLSLSLSRSLSLALSLARSLEYISTCMHTYIHTYRQADKHTCGHACIHIGIIYLPTYQI